MPRWWEKYPPVLDPDDPDWETHPPKVAEIVPPRHDTTVPIILFPFSDDGRSRRRSFRVPPKRVTATKRGLQDLHESQEKLLRRSRYLLAKAAVNMGDLALECGSAISEFRKDTVDRWPQESAEAYRAILRYVLSRRQRSEYDRLEGQGKERDEIWCWLFPDESQRRRIVAAYVLGLQKSQNAWAVSKTLATRSCRRADECIIEMRDFVRHAKHVCSSYRGLAQDIAGADARRDQSRRELTWLQAKLAAERDVKGKIGLRKQIADKQVEAKQLEVASKRQSRILSSFTWRIRELSASDAAVSARLVALQECRTAHLDVLRHVLSLDGQMSNQCSKGYGELRRALAEELSVARRHGRHLPRHVRQRLDRMLRNRQ